jgi:hypothetical protein
MKKVTKVTKLQRKVAKIRERLRKERRKELRIEIKELIQDRDSMLVRVNSDTFYDAMVETTASQLEVHDLRESIERLAHTASNASEGQMPDLVAAIKATALVAARVARSVSKAGCELTTLMDLMREAGSEEEIELEVDDAMEMEATRRSCLQARERFEAEKQELVEDQIKAQERVELEREVMSFEHLLEEEEKRIKSQHSLNENGTHSINVFRNICDSQCPDSMPSLNSGNTYQHREEEEEEEEEEEKEEEEAFLGYDTDDDGGVSVSPPPL